jgi:hypothetical protein
MVGNFVADIDSIREIIEYLEFHGAGYGSNKEKSRLVKEGTLYPFGNGISLNGQAYEQLFTKYYSAIQNGLKKIQYTKFKESHYNLFQHVLGKDKDYPFYLLDKYFNQKLISWEESSRLEINCQEVMCITKNLEWAVGNLDDIISNVERNPKKTYRYIVIDDGRDAKSNSNIINSVVADSGLEDNIVIRKVSDLDGYSKSDYWPIFNDIVLYCGAGSSYLMDGKEIEVLENITVTSLTNISSTTNKSSDYGYDAILDKRSFNDLANASMYTWFRRAWD